MKKYFVIIILVVVAMAFVGNKACDYGKNLFETATKQMQVTKPAPSLTQEYHGGLIQYVK